VKVYVFTGAALLALTLISFGVSRLDLGAAEMPVAMAIATIKVGLVALYFMHLRHAPAGERIFAISGLVMYGVLFGIAATDAFVRRTAGYLPN
jgi:cytochrome c oxidase subunit 4